MEQHNAKFTLLKQVGIGLLISLIMLLASVALGRSCTRWPRGSIAAQ